MFEELQEKEEGKGGGSITSSKEVFNICQFLIFFFFLNPIRGRNLIIERPQNSIHLYFETFMGP